MRERNSPPRSRLQPASAVHSALSSPSYPMLVQAPQGDSGAHAGNLRLKGASVWGGAAAWLGSEVGRGCEVLGVPSWVPQAGVVKLGAGGGVVGVQPPSQHICSSLPSLRGPAGRRGDPTTAPSMYEALIGKGLFGIGATRLGTGATSPPTSALGWVTTG